MEKNNASMETRALVFKLFLSPGSFTLCDMARLRMLIAAESQ